MERERLEIRPVKPYYREAVVMERYPDGSEKEILTLFEGCEYLCLFGSPRNIGNRLIAGVSGVLRFRFAQGDINYVLQNAKANIIGREGGSWEDIGEWDIELFKGDSIYPFGSFRSQYVRNL